MAAGLFFAHRGQEGRDFFRAVGSQCATGLAEEQGLPCPKVTLGQQPTSAYKERKTWRCT